MSDSLVYIGKIIELAEIPNSDFISSATVICGKGGRWRGVVRKDEYRLDDLCVVFLPDALIPPNEQMKFMESSNWRVKMRRFRGVASEVVIMPFPKPYYRGLHIGDDITNYVGVTKYFKPIPENLAGKCKGLFPQFIPKTDEPNYQRSPELIEQLTGKAFYVSLKMDGSSTTAYKYKSEFGVCSRNLELIEEEHNGYWKVANKYDLRNKLPEGIALQWETCGPGIQKNQMGLKQIEGFAFSGYNIEEHRYLNLVEFLNLTQALNFPVCEILETGCEFCPVGLESGGEGTYENGNEREGVVVRSQENFGHAPISFKVINLNYET